MAKTYIVAPSYSIPAPHYPRNPNPPPAALSAAGASPAPAVEAQSQPEEDQVIDDPPSVYEGDGVADADPAEAAMEGLALEEPELVVGDEVAAEPVEPQGAAAEPKPAVAPPAQSPAAPAIPETHATAQAARVNPTLHLGDIFNDPFAAKLFGINRDDRKNIPFKDIYDTDSKPKFRATREEVLNGRFGVWGSLFAAIGLPVGLEFGLFMERNCKDVITADEVVTHEFIATYKFVQDSMELESVKTYLEGYSGAPPALYMVTGVKIAYGASVEKVSSSKGGGTLGFKPPASEAQKIVEFSRSRETSTGFGDPNDPNQRSKPFILAFQVEKILYKKGKWEHKLFTKGASMCDGSQAIGETQVEVSGLEKGYVVDDGLGEGEDYVVVEDGHVNWIAASSEL